MNQWQKVGASAVLASMALLAVGGMRYYAQHSLASPQSTDGATEASRIVRITESDLSGKNSHYREAIDPNAEKATLDAQAAPKSPCTFKSRTGPGKKCALTLRCRGEVLEVNCRSGGATCTCTGRNKPVPYDFRFCEYGDGGKFTSLDDGMAAAIDACQWPVAGESSAANAGKKP